MKERQVCETPWMKNSDGVICKPQIKQFWHGRESTSEDPGNRGALQTKLDCITWQIYRNGSQGWAFTEHSSKDNTGLMLIIVYCYVQIEKFLKIEPNVLLIYRNLLYRFFSQACYQYFELYTALCWVLGLKKMSINLTEKALLISCLKIMFLY